MKTLLVPIDFSDVTARVLEKASELAKALGGRLVVLHVIQPPVNLSASDPILIENTARITAAAEKAADKHLERLEKGLRADFPGLEVVRLTGELPAGEQTAAAISSATTLLLAQDALHVAKPAVRFTRHEARAVRLIEVDASPEAALRSYAGMVAGEYETHLDDLLAVQSELERKAIA